MSTDSSMEFVDPTATTIVLAAQRGDSINRIAKKIDVSYSWVYDWIERLVDAGIIAKDDTGTRVMDHEVRRRYADLVGTLYSRGPISQAEAYVVPHFAGMEFAYTEIDAAYVWTEGGYQIARSHDDYSVFVRVHDRDVDRWLAFFESFGVDATIDERPEADDVQGSVHYVLFPTTEGFDVAWVDGNPVIPLEEAVDLLLENRPAYEPALEILDEEHDLDLDVDVEPRHHRPGTSD